MQRRKGIYGRIYEASKPRGRAPRTNLPRLSQHIRNLVLGMGIRIKGLEFAQHPIGFEPNRARVRAEIRASEDPRGPSRHVVTFESFEQRQFDLGLLSDRGQRDLLFLALEPELRSERFIHRTPTGKSIAHPTGPHTHLTGNRGFSLTKGVLNVVGSWPV